jgi:CubicO group peptidase (beta-lactamase class C family)
VSKTRVKILSVLALTAAGLGAWSPARAALGEPLQTAPTAWYWYIGISPAQVSSLITSKNVRLVSLRVESASPLLLDVSVVQNTGTYAKTWWWYYGVTEQELQNLATANDARIVNLEPYVVAGQTYFAAIMLHNVGADYSGWWWYYGITPSEISHYLSANDARLIDLRQYTSGSSTLYGVVMVPNTGADKSAWWWYYNISASEVSKYLSQNNAYLVGIDPADPAGTTFNVIMNAWSPGFSWWWYYGESVTQAEKLATSNGARIFDAKSYVVGGTRRAAVLMLGNTWSSVQSSEGTCDDGVIAGWDSNLPAVGLGSASSTAAYDKVITGLMQKYDVPGGAVAVIDNGKLVLARGYGLSDTGNHLIAHPDSLFRIASLSKQITSAAILTLVQQGKLKLDDHPFAILGFTPDPTALQTAALSSITIQNLLDHTGGWSRETGCSNCSSEGDPMFESESIAASQGMPSPPDCDQIIRYMLSQPVYWKPGTVYDYSNFGYCVLGAVIEKVTGMPYATFARNSVLTPSGADGIVQGQTIWAADREVVYYDFPGAIAGQDVLATNLDAYTNPYGDFYLEAMAAHGAWVASPVDLLRVQATLDGRNGKPPMLTATSLSEMTANPNVLWSEINAANLLTTYTLPGYWYGFGWEVNSWGNWWHFGSLPGTVTEQVHAANGFGWAAFFNSRPANSDQFNTDLDSGLWTAFNNTTSFLSTDLFDQYGTYTSWLDGAAYQATFNTEQAAGKYPSRVEGFNSTGTPLYRAVFAPVPGVSWESNNGMTCQTYQSKASSMAKAGYETASLQSYVSNDGTRRYQSTWVKIEGTATGTAPTPTVMIAVSPSSITQGKSATITWSSTNATGCTASGAWNGAEAVSGSLSVTPASKGSLTYALACTGSSGMANGSATLTVTAPPSSGSGGGALGVWSLLGLAFLGLTGRVSRRI